MYPGSLRLVGCPSFPVIEKFGSVIQTILSTSTCIRAINAKPNNGSDR